MFNYLNVKIGDKKSDTISAKEAWGLILAKKYESDLIKKIVGERRAASIEVNGGDNVDFKEFSKNFNSLFK